MPKMEELLRKLLSKPSPTNFTTREFDGPHPGNELYRYQIKMIIKFLGEVGEI